MLIFMICLSVLMIMGVLLIGLFLTLLGFIVLIVKIVKFIWSLIWLSAIR